MTTKHLAILLAVLLIGMGSVFVLPHQLGFQPVGIVPELPDHLNGGWFGKDLDVSQKEKDVLGEDVGTTIVRKFYNNGAYGVVASIVLSGEDMSRSIHRPERCMPAQGFTVIDDSTVPVTMPERGIFKVTRLLNVRNVPSEGGGAPGSVYNVTYYWFVGHTETTSSHNVRTWLDMRDRLIHGYNQRWAYITVAGQVPAEAVNDPKIGRIYDDLLKGFIKELAPRIQKDSVQIASVN